MLNNLLLRRDMAHWSKGMQIGYVCVCVCVCVCVSEVEIRPGKVHVDSLFLISQFLYFHAGGQHNDKREYEEVT